jgi:DnaK suppressor protein
MHMDESEGTDMSNKSPKLEAAFIERKRRQLMTLRDELRKTTNAAEAEEGNIKNESALRAREYEDDAQKLDMLEREGTLVSRDIERLARVARALKKIDEGTYGYSDISGQRIPDDRLEAMPDAVNTLAEQKAIERTG